MDPCSPAGRGERAQAPAPEVDGRPGASPPLPSAPVEASPVRPRRPLGGGAPPVSRGERSALGLLSPRPRSTAVSLPGPERRIRPARTTPPAAGPGRARSGRARAGKGYFPAVTPFPSPDRSPAFRPGGRAQSFSDSPRSLLGKGALPRPRGRESDGERRGGGGGGGGRPPPPSAAAARPPPSKRETSPLGLSRPRGFTPVRGGRRPPAPGTQPPSALRGCA